MTREPTAGAEDGEAPGGLVILVALALLAGAAAGLIAALFRLALRQADHWRELLVEATHSSVVAGPLLVALACGAATALAAGLVRRFNPDAAGSGIPHVEAVLRGKLPPARPGLIPIKFAGGVLAMGAGLALGREGPSVQMGASAAMSIGRLFRRSDLDCRVLLAAGAGAGLATAFNAPIAGAVFVLEELMRRFEQRTAIAALAASATAISVARMLLGDATDFHLPELSYATAEARPLYFLFGAVAGSLAVAYNRTLLATTAALERLQLPVEVRAGLIGAAVGALAWLMPGLVGGGDPITQRTLLGSETLLLVAIAFLLRFGLSVLSYAAGTPGGLFAPLLVLGSQTGLLCGAASRALLPGLSLQPEAFAVVGMAAFFTGVVRAPVTGIVLVTEMTGSVTMLLPMLGACAIAMLVPAVLRNPPIYESLHERLLQRAGAESADRQ